MSDEDGARDLYYRSTGQTSGWYELSAEEKAYWRGRYRDAKRRADEILNEVRRGGLR